MRCLAKMHFCTHFVLQNVRKNRFGALPCKNAFLQGNAPNGPLFCNTASHNLITLEKRKKGVEPSAFALARQRSTTELLSPRLCINGKQSVRICCALLVRCKNAYHLVDQVLCLLHRAIKCAAF